MSYKASDGTRQWDGSKNVPEERMADKLQSFARTGITPDVAGADLSYALKLQFARWKAKGLRATMEVVPYGDRKPQMPQKGFCWQDEKYSHERRFDMGKRTQKYFRDEKCIYTRDSVVGINAIVTDTTAPAGVVENDDYCCPSCGASSKIKELMTGCPYCQTKFLMPDLFPKVTNFYFVEDDSSNPKIFKPAVIIGAVLMLLYEVALGVRHQDVSFLFGAPIAMLIGAFLGYMCAAFLYLGYAIYRAVQGVGEVSGSKKAERKIENRMRVFDKTFSFKLFEGQLISFLKMTLFTEDPGNLACFEGTHIPERYRDLIDMSYHGTLSLKGIETVGDVVRMNIGVFLRNTYCVNNRISDKDEEITLWVEKKATAPTDAGFSIKKVACKSCGGSFDASRQRICPFCQSVYDMKEQNWVITKIGE